MASQKADCFCMPLESRRMGCFSFTVVKMSFSGLVPFLIEAGVKAPEEPHHVPGGGGEEIIEFIRNGGDAGLDRRIFVHRLPATSTSPSSWR